MGRTVEIDYKSNRAVRILDLYERLIKGEYISKAEMVSNYEIAPKTAQRDIDELRNYIAEKHKFEVEAAIAYDRSKNAYYLVKHEREWFTNQEILAMSKILLESRAFAKGELKILMDKLLLQVIPKDKKIVEQIIRSEHACYVPLKHNKNLFAVLWDLSQSIVARKIVKFAYKRVDGREKVHQVKPVAIMFSEYYFYLISFMNTTDCQKKYPTVFRIDRMSKLEELEERFSIPYAEEFSEGEFRKRVQFMYAGELRRVEFEFSGSSLEAVLDRLPTAEAKQEKDGVYIIEAEVYGIGIDMWLKSQGDNVKVLN